MIRRKTTLILALITGILLVTALPAVSEGPHRDGGGPGEGGGPMCMAFIPGITADQLESIAAIRDEHHDAMQDLRDKLYEAKNAFRELMRDPDPDLAAVRKAKEKLDALETDMLIARLEMRAAVRNILTDGQRIFFDEMQAFDHHEGGMDPGMGSGPGMGSCPGMGPGSGMGPGPGMSDD
ncbi:MAG: Spy/CpxP family protein refolding chaperone [bacterium]|nr:Spy/CpxP family protein refolding chaperone [bacterium]